MTLRRGSWECSCPFCLLRKTELEINLPEALIRSLFNHHTSSRTYLYYYLNFTYKDPQAPLSNLPHSRSGAELGLKTQRFFIPDMVKKESFHQIYHKVLCIFLWITIPYK